MTGLMKDILSWQTVMIVIVAIMLVFIHSLLSEKQIDVFALLGTKNRAIIQQTACIRNSIHASTFPDPISAEQQLLSPECIIIPDNNLICRGITVSTLHLGHNHTQRSSSNTCQLAPDSDVRSLTYQPPLFPPRQRASSVSHEAPKWQRSGPASSEKRRRARVNHLSAGPCPAARRTAGVMCRGRAGDRGRVPGDVSGQRRGLNF